MTFLALSNLTRLFSETVVSRCKFTTPIQAALPSPLTHNPTMRLRQLAKHLALILAGTLSYGCGGPPNDQPSSSSSTHSQANQAQQISEITFVDPIFAQCVYDTGAVNIADLTVLQCDHLLQNEKIKNFSGIENLWALEDLSLIGEQMSELDLSLNDSITSLTLIKNANLIELNMPKNAQVNTLTLESSTKLASLDLSSSHSLKSLSLNCGNSVNCLREIHFSSQVQLQNMTLQSMHDGIVLADHSFLETLSIAGYLAITPSSLSHNERLKNLKVDHYSHETIDLTHNRELLELNFVSQALTQLDLSENKKLKILSLGAFANTPLQLAANLELEELNLSHYVASSLDLSNNAKLIKLSITSSFISALDITSQVLLKELSLIGNASLKSVLMPTVSALNAVSIGGANVNFSMDSHNLSALEELHLSCVAGSGITLDYCKGPLDLTQNTRLKTLELRYGYFTELDLSRNTQLENLVLLNYPDELHIDLSSNINLSQVEIAIPSLDTDFLSNNPLVKHVTITSSKLDTLTTSNLENLTSLTLKGTNIQTLDLSANRALRELTTQSTPLAAVDLANNHQLEKLVL